MWVNLQKLVLLRLRNKKKKKSKRFNLIWASGLVISYFNHFVDFCLWKLAWSDLPVVYLLRPPLPPSFHLFLSCFSVRKAAACFIRKTLLLSYRSATVWGRKPARSSSQSQIKAAHLECLSDWFRSCWDLWPLSSSQSIPADVSKWVITRLLLWVIPASQKAPLKTIKFMFMFMFLSLFLYF